MHLRLWDALTSIALVVTCSTPSVHAWGAAGHEIAATIAQIHLHPSVFPRLCAALNYTSPSYPALPLCHLAPVASWADRYRYKMPWSSTMHYIGAVGDNPSETCLFPGMAGWENPSVNVLAGIRNTTNFLQEGWGEEADNEAVKFLIHFLGDAHMPLHLTGRDRGGNSVKVLFDHRQSNLHSVWDGKLIAKSLRTIPGNYSLPTAIKQVEYNLRGTIYDSYVRRLILEGTLGRWNDELESWLTCPSSLSSNNTTEGGGDRTDDDIVCPFYWAQPIHALNCALVWPKELDEPPYSHPELNWISLTLSSVLQSLFRVRVDDISALTRFGRRPQQQYLELDTPEYAGRIEQQWVVEKLLTQAGIRLAGILNWLYADVDEEELRLLGVTRSTGGLWVMRPVV